MTLWSIPSWFSVAILSGLAVFLWLRRPPAALWPSALLCNVLALCWVLGDLATSFTTEYWQEELATTLLFTGSIGTVVSWWVVAVAYTRWQGLGFRWLDGPWPRIPVAVCFGFWLMMLTNHWHGQFTTPVVGARNDGHWGALATVYFCYPMVAGSSLLFFALSTVHESREQRANARILSVATLLPLSMSAAYAFGPWQLPLDFAAVGLGLGGIAVAYGIFRNRLFSQLPVALPEVLRHDPTPVLLTDPDGRLIYWNPAVPRLFPNLRLEHGIGIFKGLSECLRHPGDEKPVHDAVGLEYAVLDPVQPEAGHLFQLHPATEVANEDVSWVRISAASIPSRWGDVVAHALRVVDITAQRRGELQRRALETQIQHVEKLRSLGVLAGGIAHDFNNRLTVILGNASLALLDLSPGDPIHESVEEIEDVAKNAAELTQQLLAYSGRAQFAVEPVNLSELVQAKLPLLEQSISAKISLTLRTENDLPSIEADPIQLLPILQNLVINASESMGTHSGEIVLRTSWVERVKRPQRRDPYGQKIAPLPHIALEVSDNGCGMDDETRRRIFDPFFSTKFNGRGLGMAAAYGIVRAHNGAILIESKIGHGSTVTVLFPVAEDMNQAWRWRRSEPTRQNVNWHPSGSVLVVDDEAPVRRVASSILTRAGFDILIAAGGREALEVLKTHRDEIRLVLLDLSMPGMNGEETLRAIRNTDPLLPVLLSSGYDETDAMSRIGPADRVNFVHKPYTADGLIDCVRDTLGD